MKNKLLIKICISIILVLIIVLLTMHFLGNKTRIGYLSDFNLDIDKTLELNNLQNIKSNFYDNKRIISNYIFTNSNITNYIFRFRIRYYDKIFRNSDIYGVYPNLNNFPEFIKETEMEYGGSPYGDLISNKIIEEEKIDNINYILKIKPKILLLILFIIYLLLIPIFSFLEIKFNFDIGKYFDNKINNISCIIILMLLVFIIMFFSLELKNFKFGMPLKYNYRDTITVYNTAAMIKNQGWYPIQTDRLGAPFGSYFGSFPSSLLVNFEVLLQKIISIFIQSPMDIVSIAYFIIFPITAIISFYSLRNLKISKFMSIFGSLTFTFIPFMFMRNIAHYVLSTIYFIPLSILLCIWLYEKDDLLMPTKNLKEFFNIYIYKNIIAIIFIILISNNGIAYYPFFTCFLIIVSMISKLLKTKNIKTVIPFIVSIALICFFMIINLIPFLIYKSNHIFTSSIKRVFFEAEIAGLKISHLILNPKYFLEYYSKAMLVNENRTSYFGIIGLIGFCLLIIYIFVKNYHKPLVDIYKNRISLLSELNLFAILLATIGGFASLFNYFISPMIRSYNRISVFIAFICILSFCIFVENIVKKRNIIFYLIFSMILLITLYDQTQDTEFYDKNEMKMYINDKKYIENIENIMPKNSSIYQLPTISYNDMEPPVKSKYGEYKHYRHFIGYIFSKKLKWSYGADHGRIENEWYDKVNEMDSLDLLNEIFHAGFDGLYIDRGLLGNEELANKIEEDLKNILKGEPLIHEDGSILFFNLINFEADKEYLPLINGYK